MDDKTLRLDFDASLSEAISGNGFLHFGLWPDGSPDLATFALLGAAQQAWFDRMARTIPEGVRSILDVGSGTGGNARALIQLGYDVECVSPSAHLNDMARRKLPAGTLIHLAKFETLDLPRTFDLCLFGESFHYIDLTEAIAQFDRYARRHVLIFDYFRRVERGSDGSRGTHAAFRRAMGGRPEWSVVQDDDLTVEVLPTFDVLEKIRTDHLAPFVSRTRSEFRRRRPLVARLAEIVFGRRLDRVAQPSRRAERFRDECEYRLIRLDRRLPPQLSVDQKTG